LCVCGYGLLGRVDTRYRLHDIRSHHSIGAAKDSWEAKRIHAVEFSQAAWLRAPALVARAVVVDVLALSAKPALASPISSWRRP
jgi:hypothetical protein